MPWLLEVFGHRGWVIQGSPQLWLEWGQRQLSLGEAVEELSMRPGYPDRTVPGRPGWWLEGWGRYWRPCLSEPAGDLAGAQGWPGIGQKDLKVPAMPLFVHKVPLTTPARSLAPCRARWEQVICRHRPLQGWRRPPAMVGAGLSGWWAFACVVGLPFPLGPCAQGQAGPLWAMPPTKVRP